jgi:N-acetylneuraminate synthase
MKTVKIDRFKIGPGHPFFIIAEAGSNHDGNFDQALKLIDVAADAGVDAIKFQSFHARTLYPNSRVTTDYLRSIGLKKTLYQMIEDMEMPFEWIPKLAAHCRKKKILFLSTPFDEEATDQLDPFVAAFKIASYELNHVPLLQHVAGKKKPVILSTGAATLSEIDRAVADLRKVPLCLMQCTAKYPAPIDSLNLRSIQTLSKRYGVPVGLSDHSMPPVPGPVAALALGANLIEKHFTLSRNLKGPDHSYAIEPAELKAMVQALREAEKMLGHGRKEPLPVERELREYRSGVFSLTAIKKGETLSRENVAVLRRTGQKETNLHPKQYASLLGKPAARAIPARRLMSAGDISK